MTTGHQTERLSHRPQGFNRRQPWTCSKELKTVAGHRVAAAVRADKGTVTFPVIEPKPVNPATTGHGP